MTDRRRSGLLLFWTWFNVLPLGSARRTEQWTEERFRFWLSFTLRSIIDQRETEWRYWLICARSLRNLTDPLRPAVTDPRVRMVFDDECPARLARLPPAERYLLTRVDSDDLYHPVTASTLLGQRSRTSFLQFNRGFALDVGSGQVLPWRSASSPFYTHVYGEEIRSLEAWQEPNHTTVAPWATTLGSGHFMVSIHGANTSTTRAAARGQPLGHGRGASVAAQFGLGGDRRMAELSGVARIPVRWEDRFDRLRGEAIRALDGTTIPPTAVEPSPSAIALVALAAELSAARRVSVVADTVSAWIIEILVGARCAVANGGRPPDPGDQEGPYDVAFVDLRACSGHGPVRTALASVVATGLVVICGINTERDGARLQQALNGVLVDRYPEVAAVTADTTGRSWLLGRPLMRRPATEFTRR